LKSGTNYISVRVYDNADNVSVSTDVFYIRKDTATPTVVDNQSGDDSWYNSNPGSIFNVDFYDYNSRLLSASYYAYTQPNKGGVFVSSADISGVYNVDSFTSNWGVDFDKLKEGYNYISVVVKDIAENTTEYVDAFYIKKDTSSPIIEDLQSGDTNWYSLNPGNIFNINFYDYGIGITTISVKVTTGPSMTGTVLIDGSTYYLGAPTGQINGFGFSDYQWSLLDNGTSYVSLYAYDGLGNVRVSTDVFYIQKDTVPPSAITTLNSTTLLNAVDEGSILLDWIATGDDGTTGAAKSYLIRYATYSISSSNFDSASVYNSTLVPKSAGLSESLKMTGLSPGTTYYIAIKAVDKAGNKSDISNTTSTYATPDLTPPYAITDLNAVPGDFTGQIKINWTARGEGTAGVEGTNAATGYIVKYATYSISSTNFDSAPTYSQSWIPKQPGQTEEHILEGLTPEATYYIAIKSYDEVNNISNISNTTSTYAAPRGARDALIVYSKSGSTTLKYRKYSNAQWSAEYDTGISFAGTVRWIVLRSIPVIRNVVVAGVIDSNNTLRFLKYDGINNIWSDITPTPAPIPGNSLYRNFDISVEQNNGRVVVAYYNGTLGSVNYAVWSSTSNSWVVGPTSLAMASLTGQIYWVRLKSAPNSNRVALAVLDANSDISAAIWNGDSWIDNVNLTLSAAIATGEDFDIAWESLTGDLLALWGTGTTTNYRKWYSTSTWGASLAGPNIGGTANWIRLCSSPLSDKIGFTSLDGGSDWNVAIWRPTGTEGWSALPTEDAAMSANDKRVTDCAWQSKTEKFMAIAVDDLGTYDNQFDWITWSNGTWSPASPSVTVANTNTTFSTDIKWTSLLNDPDTDNIMAWAVDTSNNLRSTVWSGTGWAAVGSGNNFYHGLVQDYNYESFAIEFKREDNIPPTLTDNQSGDDIWRNSNYATYSVFANDSGGSLLKEIQTRIYTGASGRGVLVEDWTPQISNINSSSYSTPWMLSNATFNKLVQGATNYIWVMAVDNAGNISSTIIDAFYVKKDTTPPTITSNISTTSFNFWTSTGVGSINIDFSDYGGSKLSSATYSVWTSTNLSGTNVANNILISSNINQNVYDTDWNINFSLLANGTNYISVVVWDNAGSSTTLIDAFKVLKDTIPPSAVTDLSASPGPTAGTVLLSFSAPGDDGTSGNNTQGGYIIKYATFSITTNALFELATTYNETIVPSNYGSTENIVIYGLNEGTTYFFALKSYDKANNLSLISNSTSSLPQTKSVFINEIYPSGSAGNDWVELYNNTSQSFSLDGWKLVYRQGAVDDSSAPEVEVWTGTTTDSISSGNFKLINLSFDLNSALSYSIILKNQYGKIVDRLQWPALSQGQSFSRIYDGSLYFEIDPSPTPGYANSISTYVKINEVSYRNWEFIELYNSTNSLVHLNGYALRNKNNILFRFNRKIFSYSYIMIDSSTLSLDNYSFSDAFGWLDENGDFVALENNLGQTLDRVSWKASIAPLYNFKAQSAINASYAPASSITSIIRSTDGFDTDDDGIDFVNSPKITPLYRNSNSELLGNNTLIYPSENKYIPYNFPLKLQLNTTNYSSGYNDIIAFMNTDGKDGKSPHIFRLSDLGFDISTTSQQEILFNLGSFTDIDGNNLVDKAVYKVLFITDSSTSTSNAIWLSSVTTDMSYITANAYDTRNVYLSADRLVDIFKLVVYNPAGYDIYITSVSLSFKTTDYINITTEQLKNMLKSIKIIKDYGNNGIFEEGVDSQTLVSVLNDSFSVVDGTISLDIQISSVSLIPTNSSSTYFVVFVSSDNSYSYNPNQFLSLIDINKINLSDSINYIPQNKTTSYSIWSSTISSISPSADYIWSYNTNIYSNIDTTVNYWSNVYITANDGILRTLDYNIGGEKWSFATNPLSAIKTSPLVSIGPNNEVYLYFATSSGDVYKIQDNDTSYLQIWKTNIGTSSVKGNIYDSDTSIYLGTEDNRIICLNKSNGAVCNGWSYDSAVNSAINSDFTIDFRSDVNLGWVGLLNGKVLAFRLTDGVVLNQFLTGGAVYSAPFVESAYSQASNNLFIASTDGKLYSRVASNLTITPTGWSDVVLSSAVYSSPYKPPYKNYILVGDDSGRLYKIDSTSGTILAVFKTDWPIRSMPLEWNGVVYFTSGKYIYAVNEADFSLKPGYPFYLGSEVRGNMVLDNYDGYLFFSTNAGKVYSIDLW
ncbi:MAG: lamin tail domain-containing protein, partial [Elusimicrobiales bacterium]